MFPSLAVISGQSRTEIPAAALRRSWMSKRVSVSDALRDVVIDLALGNRRADVAAWPEPSPFQLAEATR